MKKKTPIKYWKSIKEAQKASSRCPSNFAKPLKATHNAKDTRLFNRPTGKWTAPNNTMGRRWCEGSHDLMGKLGASRSCVGWGVIGFPSSLLQFTRCYFLSLLAFVTSSPAHTHFISFLSTSNRTPPWFSPYPHLMLCHKPATRAVSLITPIYW